jgi:hypothetical protein
LSKTKKQKTQYAFFTYIKRTFNLYFLKKNHNIVLKGKNSNILNLVLLHKTALFSNYLFKDKNVFNFVQLMFIITSNPKQYFLTFSGLNVTFFKTVSTGKILKKKGLLTKSLKKSHKALKYLLLFVKDITKKTVNNISHHLLRPINKKNLDLFYLVLRNCNISVDNIGFRHHYKSVFKTERRIKRRIKKKLLAKFTSYN